MIAAVLIGLALAVAALAALSLRLSSPLTTLLAAYLALVGNVALVTWALSPFDAVTRTGLFVAEAILLVAAGGAWWARGRPRPPLDTARAAWHAVSADPLMLAFLAVAVAALAYELVLALTVPPNNYDSLTYHLTRVAAWKQEGGIHWVANAPTDRINEFQPLAEQENLFLFVAAAGDALYALPQFVAQLAILAAVYGASRRLGFGHRAAICSAALFATFSVVALQATTAQNDLVAAALPITAACLLLNGGRTEALLAGAALGMGLGVKLTTVLTWPVLAWLAWIGGRGAVKRAAVGALTAFLAVGVWGFVLNLAHTGHLLGHGGGRVDQSVSPSFVTVTHTFVRVVYRMLDLSVLSNWLIWLLAAVGIAAGTLVLLRKREAGSRTAVLAGAAVALPLLAGALVLGLAPVLAWFTRLIHLPVTDPVYGFSINRDASEDFSAFGPIGALALIGVPILVVVAHRADRRQLALALALPSYVVLLALYAKYNIWITRFLLVPAALTAPLFGHLFRGRAATAAVLAVGALTIGLTLERDVNKPLTGPAPLPWTFDRGDALRQSPAQPTGRKTAEALTAYERRVPADACVGAVLDPDEWSYPLWGPRLEHRIVFLPSLTALATAIQKDVGYVVVSTGANAPVAEQFSADGWRRVPLGTHWTLMVSPRASPRCDS